MKLDDDFTIEGKEYEWTLKLARETDQINPQTEKPIVNRNEWHYPTLKSALKKYVNESLKPAQSITEILLRLDELEEKIEKLSTK